MRHSILNDISITFFATPEQAPKIADANSKDDDWSYVAGVTPHGKNVVRIFDEDEVLLGMM